MLSVILLNFLILLSCSTSEVDRPLWQACLPQNVKLSDVVSVKRGKNGMAVSKRTVDDQLKELKARCRGGELIDNRGREIYFYRLTGCWGNAPVDYLEILEQQRIKLRELRKHYTVVEMTCDLSDGLVP
jgi:hypothetical protein